jgi:AbrB family looped-hinge helix DNA binding protein
MITKLVKHGGSYAIVIPKAIREILGLVPGQPVEVSTDGKALFIMPTHRTATDKEFKAAMSKTMKKHGKALKKLADL